LAPWLWIPPAFATLGIIHFSLWPCQKLRRTVYQKNKECEKNGKHSTLQEFMLHTKNITYLLIVAALVGITGFWLFLTDRDED
jgi:hypothetical protein